MIDRVEYPLGGIRAYPETRAPSRSRIVFPGAGGGRATVPPGAIVFRGAIDVSGIRTSRHRWNAVLAVTFGIWFAMLAINPVSRSTWLLENGLVIAFVAILALTYRSFPFSRISYTLIFLFLCLHEIGSHYTYSEVPYDDWFERFTGATLNARMGWERNHFDRAIHLAYGLLLTYPIREIFLRVARVRGFWGYFFPLDFAMSTSLTYELIEWGAAAAFGGDLGQSYLGTQGDAWDAHKDMALAALGALIAMTVTLVINLVLQRDFAAEWAESLRVKGKDPLGEERLSEMLAEREAP
jgi:putative membrane protein